MTEARFFFEIVEKVTSFHSTVVMSVIIKAVCYLDSKKEY